jgi:hypothetical protein
MHNRVTDTLNDVWVIDTSSILEVRRSFEGAVQPRIYSDLTRLVEGNSLVYPPEVYDELERYSNTSNDFTDSPFEWAKKNKSRATRLGHRYEELKEVLGHPRIQNVLDSEKIGVEEADSHILSLALCLIQEGSQATVITEERRDRPNKLSLNTACSLLKIPCLRMYRFLIQQNIL